MKFNYQATDLPVKEIIGQVQDHLSSNNTLIVQAPPGAGKSTLLPLTLLEEEWLQGKKILMLEPRRLATKSIADRMSELMGEATGQTIGYRIRFEQKISEDTRLEVLTEGILARMLHTDNSLEEVGLVIFDEFHERNIHADLALALCREAQQVLRPDLRIMIMSATLDMPQLESLLGTQSIVSKGKQYPVDIRYTSDADPFMLPELTARIVLQAVKENEGDTLVFLPGQGEIRKCEEILRNQLPGFKIHPLYGQLPFGKQYAALRPDANGKRKVVLATSIAETSLTIEGIKVVVDSGYGRTSKFDPRSGLARLETVQIAVDSADQRAGRAGRLGPGVCYRMWTKATHHNLKEHRTPEIMEADLAHLALNMYQWGIRNVHEMAWLTPPPRGPYQQAVDTLDQIEALYDGKITAHGEKLAALPCHPRIAHMLLMAQEVDQLPLACDLAALLEERDPLGNEAGIDINLRIEALRRLRKENRLGKKFSRIEKIASSYRRLFTLDEADNAPFDPFETGLLLAYAYPERIACARPGNNAQFQLANGKLAVAGHKDDLAHESWLAVAHIDARDGMGKIFLASQLDPKDLASMVKQKEIIAWDHQNDEIKASIDLRIGNIVLQSRPIADPDTDLIKETIIEVVKSDGEKLLNFDNDFKQWQNRLTSLKKWNPELSLPDFTTSALLKSCSEWLTPYLENIRSADQLKKLDLRSMLLASLDWELKQQIDELAPERITVPSGSNIQLDYQADGEPPILAVRLQECFGLSATPRINQGKTPILMHLLSPGFKPVQVTTDLKSFWDNTYFEVRKELKRRYPKHSWPDDPWTEVAIRGVKKRK